MCAKVRPLSQVQPVLDRLRGRAQARCHGQHTHHRHVQHFRHRGLLAGKVAFITGAGRGIGADAARLFARESAHVLLEARTEAQLKAVTEEIRASGGTAEYVVCDSADAASVRAAVDRAVDLYGRLDIAFNNGAAIQRPGPMDRMPEDDFDHIYDVNLKGIWLAMIAEVKAIRATAGTGVMVNNSSVSSLMGNPELPTYGAMKRAVNSLTESAAVTYGPKGISVNAIAPGTTATEMIRTWEEHSPGPVERFQRAHTPAPRRRPRRNRPGRLAPQRPLLLCDRHGPAGRRRCAGLNRRPRWARTGVLAAAHGGGHGLREVNGGRRFGHGR